MDLKENLNRIRKEVPGHVDIVAVSKTKPASMVMELFRAGQLDFGENKVQELLAKKEELPEDIRWHMIGHLQSNKVKYIAPFVYMIHAVDSLKLLQIIEKEGAKNSRTIPCLLQVHIAAEETKFGFSEEELFSTLSAFGMDNMVHVDIRGLMGMATFTDDSDKVRAEFRNLKRIFEETKKRYFQERDSFKILSMGMSNDYLLAIEEGSTMIRIGSLIFGIRNYV